jgi:hypothetical protein
MKPRSRIPAHRALTVAAVSSALALSGLGLSACGGDDETSGSASTATASVPSGPLSGKQLASEADSLCTAANEQLQSEATAPDFGNDGPQPEELEAAAPFYRALADGQQQLFDQLSQLQPAADVADDWKAFLESYETASVEDAAKIAEQAAAGDPESFFKTSLDNQAPLQDLAGMASELGMKVCAASDTAAAAS